MCVEGLSSIIRRNEDAGLLHGCRIARGAPIISHLLFADDCYFFFKATKSEANVMKRILSRYETISGQMINYNKSSVIFSPNTDVSSRAEVCEQLGVCEVQSPGKYLGMPMHIGRRKCATFSFLSDKINQKLQGWQNQSLSKAGKVTLLKTAAQVVPNFWMNMLLIPAEVCDRIEKSMNAFWWGSGQAGKGVKWMSWEKLCTVKEDGGLGFKKLREFNIAMLARQAWRIINNANPLVTSMLRARYFPHSSVLDAKLGTNPSYVWGSLLETQAVIRQGCRRRIGDGRSTKIWQVPWLPCPLNGYLTTEMPDELKDTTVENLLEDNHREWDIEVLQDICNERDRELIKQIPIPRISKDDSWFWLFDDKGEFSVKSCYRVLRGEHACPDKVFWRTLWGLNLPGKVTNFLWRTCRKVLPTTAVLAEKRVNISVVCQWCQMQVESDLHVLFQCCFARDVWEKAGLIDVVTVFPDDTVMKVLERVLQKGGKEQTDLVGLLWWNLWSRRNSWVWERINTSIFGVKSRALSMLVDWRAAQEDMAKIRMQKHGYNRVWCKSPEGWIKINIDAVYMSGTGHTGVGCVIRDDRGCFLRARSKVVQGRMQAREAEAIGLLEALLWTKEWRKSKCLFELDAKGLVDAINGEGGRSYFHTLVDDCRDILKHFEKVLIMFVSRSANTVAHLLAKVTYSMTDCREWLDTAPDFIICTIADEAR